MRYTTIIDLTEWPDVYRNRNARDIYLYVVLRSGYHDHDRDMLRTSLRWIAQDTGITFAGVRHAVRQLERIGLLHREGNTWTVTKWVMGQQIMTRRQQEIQAKAATATDEQKQRARERELRDEERERQTAAAKAGAVHGDQLKEMAEGGRLETLRRLGLISEPKTTKK